MWENVDPHLHASTGNVLCRIPHVDDDLSAPQVRNPLSPMIYGVL